jgi:hypothetical protein
MCISGTGRGWLYCTVVVLLVTYRELYHGREEAHYPSPMGFLITVVVLNVVYNNHRLNGV